MDKQVELLLINSLAPRQRVVSDAALENSLAILRTYLEAKGILVEVYDKQRVDLFERGVPRWCGKYLRAVVKTQLGLRQKGVNWLLMPLMLAGWPVHALALASREAYLDNLIEEIVKEVKRRNIPLVGIKVWYGDAFRWSKKLSAKIRRECPETVVIAGGPQVKVYGEHVLLDQEFDLAIMGAGEEWLEKLALLRRQRQTKQQFLSAVLAQNEDIALLKGEQNTKALGSADSPAYRSSVVPVYRQEDLAGKIMFHTVVDGFGCPWNKCNFCSHTRYHSNFQPRPVEQIIEEIKTLKAQGVSFLRFSSSDTPLFHGRKIAQQILAEGIKVNYSMFTRPAKMSAERLDTYKIMIQAGLRAVFMGGETGNDLINKLVMNKGAGRQDIIDTVNCIRTAAADAGQPCRIGLSLIYPCPTVAGVTLQDIFADNMSLIKETMPDTVIVNPPGAFPGTRWFELAGEFGFHIGDDYVQKLMEYEYSIYKPAELWTRLDYGLQGMDSLAIFRESGKLRNAVADLGIPTDISDEYLMMTEAIGSTTRQDLMDFKLNTLIDIITGSTDYTRKIVEAINQKSVQLAQAGR